MNADPSQKYPSLIPRRTFLSDMGMGFAGLALGGILAEDAIARHPLPSGNPLIQPKAKNVIWLFMSGGVSQMESFDPKPALNRYAGKSLAETGFKDVYDDPFVKENFRPFEKDNKRTFRQKIFPMQIGYGKRGQSGIEVTDWWPHVSECIDDIAVVRSMWTTDNDHGAQLQFHTGRHISDGFFPSIGSWVHYGLGTLNENLPKFIVLGNPVGDCCGGVHAHQANYLGASHDGVHMKSSNPLPYGKPAGKIFHEEQEKNFELVKRLNGYSAIEYPEDSELRARIQAYELAFRMQASVPEVFDLSAESTETKELYGTGFGTQCLTARRMVERGVRFVQIYHAAGGGGGWDAHSNLKDNHTKNCLAVDKPIAALLKDLKRRGMLDETLVVWGTEFGRTPGTEGTTGRDHHPFGFSIWMAGGGVKGGVVHGATDELGLLAIEDRHYITDVHATVLHQLGLDSRKLEVPGRKRLAIEHGRPIRQILA